MPLRAGAAGRASAGAAGSAETAAGIVVSAVISLRLSDHVQAIGREALERLLLARRPADHGAVDALGGAEPEVRASLVLRAEAAAAVDHGRLRAARAGDRDLRADRAAVGGRALEG